MAGRDKTIAWENVKWIKAHIPMWEKKGMTKAFLNSIIKVKYDAVEADVESVITCDPNIFETLYNQKDFLDALKGICKRCKMPYGKVPKEVEEAAEDAADIIYPDFASVRPKRLDIGKKAKHTKDISERLKEIGYTIENKVANLDELMALVHKHNKEHPGDAKMSWSSDLIELYIDMYERGLCEERMAEIIGGGFKVRSIDKYKRVLTTCNILKSSLGKGDVRVANEDIVKFVGGRKRQSYAPAWDDFA